MASKSKKIHVAAMKIFKRRGFKGNFLQAMAMAQRKCGLVNPYSRNAKYRHKRLRSPGKFDRRSMRTIAIGKHGRKMVVGCPRGKYKRGRCKVGLRAQSILAPKRWR